MSIWYITKNKEIFDYDFVVMHGRVSTINRTRKLISNYLFVGYDGARRTAMVTLCKSRFI